MKDSQNQKKNNYKKWLVLINIPIQMGVIIFLFSYLGSWLDNRYANPNDIYVKIFTLLGVGIAFYYVIKQVNNLNKDA